MGEVGARWHWGQDSPLGVPTLWGSAGPQTARMAAPPGDNGGVTALLGQLCCRLDPPPGPACGGGHPTLFLRHTGRPDAAGHPPVPTARFGGPCPESPWAWALQHHRAQSRGAALTWQHGGRGRAPPPHSLHGSGVGAVALGRVPGSPGLANPQSSFSNWPWWGARCAARQPALPGWGRHGTGCLRSPHCPLAVPRHSAAQHPHPRARHGRRQPCTMPAVCGVPGQRHPVLGTASPMAPRELRCLPRPRGAPRRVPAIPAACWAELGAGSRSPSPAVGSHCAVPSRAASLRQQGWLQVVRAAGRQRDPSVPRSQNLMICKIRITSRWLFLAHAGEEPGWGAAAAMARLRPAARPGAGAGSDRSRARRPAAVCLAERLTQCLGTAALRQPVPSWGDLSPPSTAGRAEEPSPCWQQTHRGQGSGQAGAPCQAVPWCRGRSHPRRWRS